jgi:hypothetical protein
MEEPTKHGCSYSLFSPDSVALALDFEQQSSLHFGSSHGEKK